MELARHRGLAGDVEEMEERDHNDSTRTHSPLRKADDAIEVDTTNTSITEQVMMIVSLVKERMNFLNIERKT